VHRKTVALQDSISQAFNMITQEIEQRGYQVKRLDNDINMTTKDLT